ncbi:recombination regulator RecX [Niallia sp. BSM11]|uniref:recombination regulator RecX n=1 Tax=Niallia sp. BSM11 TaxID=3391576 RepID=UPI003984E0BC
MKISKITRQKNLSDRYNLFTEKAGKEEYAFSVDESILVKYQLRKGMELDPLLLNQIQYSDEIRKGYHTAVRYLTRMKRTEAEVRTHLRMKIEEDTVIAEVIRKLYEMKFLDDEDYAYSYVRTQKNTSDKGPELIRRELREKGLGDELISKALVELPFDVMLANAEKIAAKALSSNKKNSFKMAKQKVEQTLTRKGYPGSVIKEVKLSLDETGEEDELAALRVHGEKAQRKFSAYTGYEFKQKMKQFLYRKGFSIELIQKYLDELESFED